MANARHAIEIGGVISSIMLSDNYDNADSNIGAVLNIEKVAGEKKLPANTRPITIGAAKRTGLIVSLVIRYRGDQETKSRTGRVICPIDKAYDAIGDLVGQKYRGGTVTSASVPQRARFT